MGSPTTIREFLEQVFSTPLTSAIFPLILYFPLFLWLSSNVVWGCVTCATTTICHLPFLEVSPFVIRPLALCQHPRRPSAKAVRTHPVGAAITLSPKTCCLNFPKSHRHCEREPLFHSCLCLLSPRDSNKMPATSTSPYTPTFCALE